MHYMCSCKTQHRPQKGCICVLIISLPYIFLSSRVFDVPFPMEQMKCLINQFICLINVLMSITVCCDIIITIIEHGDKCHWKINYHQTLNPERLPPTGMNLKFFILYRSCTDFRDSLYKKKTTQTRHFGLWNKQP